MSEIKERRCDAANNFADCPFKATGRLDACHDPGGCLHRDPNLLNAAETAAGRPMRSLMAEMRDMADWIDRTKPQGVLYSSVRPSLREAWAALNEIFPAAAELPDQKGASDGPLP